MDFVNRGNNSAQTQQNSQPANNNTQPTAAFEPPKQGKGKRGASMDMSKIGGLLMLALGTVLITAVIIGLVFGGAPKESDLINGDRYQAIFLDSPDGQVYFGNLEVYNKDLYRLTDIFYVRVEQALQPEGVDQQPQPNISLAKLGNELHGPEDAMYISQDKVLYWENLKTDGQVATAIAEFDANGRNTDTTNQPTQQNPVANPAANTQPANTPPQDDTPAEAPVTP